MMQQATPSWKYSTQLGAGAVVDVPMGGENGSNTFPNVQGYKYLMFAYRFDQIVNLDIRIGLDPAAPYTWFSIAGVVGTLMTPYDAVAPIGDQGYIPIPNPFLQLRLTNTAGVATTFARFYAYVFN